jgi:hypothetical protein
MLAFEIIIVDNASSDGSIEALMFHFGGVGNLKVVKSTRNEGFAVGNNKGLARAEGRNILLLNSDTYLIDTSVVDAVSYLDTARNVFGCGCTLLNPDGSKGISYGCFPTAGTVWREVITNRFGKLRGAIPSPTSAITEIDFPCGAFYLVKASLIRELGGLDENFFMYFEETDLARRAKDLGYKTMLFFPTRLVHLGGASVTNAARKDTRRAFELRKTFYMSWNYYLRKHHGRAQLWIVNTLQLIHFISRYAWFTARGAGSRNKWKTEADALVRAWFSRPWRQGVRFDE